MNIDAVYSAKRERQYAQRIKRREKALAEIPALKLLLDEYRSLLALRAVGGETAESAAEMLKNNRAETEKLLVGHGLARDYIDQRYDCPVCRDYGVLEDGKKCVCRTELEHRLSAELSGFDASQTFESFDENVFPEGAQREMMAKLRETAARYAECIPKSLIKNFFMIGGTGLGKSFLLNCVGNALLTRGVNARYITAYDYQRIVMDEVIKGNDETRFFALLNCEFLVLDDMGTEPVINNITEPYMFTLVDTRLNAGRYTAYASNLTPDSLKVRYGERTFSRLVNPAASYLKKLDGRDIRRNKTT